MADIYQTFCTICKKPFRTRNALEKHFNKKHPGNDFPACTDFFLGDKQAPKVCPRLLKKRDQYLKWLAEVVECLNSSHNPRVPARWCHFTFTNVRADFFSHLLKRVGSAKLNSVKLQSHLKPPMWKEKAMCLSFKTYNIDDICQAMSDQSLVRLHLSKSFNGKDEIPENPCSHQLSGRAALEAAKQKTASKPSLQSKMSIGVGQGRATRECEFKWIPLFDTSSNGILTVRIYVAKVHL